MTAIRTKPLDEITWDDITALAASGAVEDAMLEFKGLLPVKSGKGHPWYDGTDDITTHTRDKLAAEVAALANAYGGRLIIGIEETKEQPRQAVRPVPLPRCAKFAEQFERMLNSLLDPPIAGLAVRAIADPGTEGAGAVVVAVPASDLAPHGIGRPPAAFVRRGTSCEEMTMRDLQSVFWEARTKRERIDRIRSSFRDQLAEAFKFGPTELEPPHQKGPFNVGQTFASPLGGSQGLFVRITAIFHQSIAMSHDKFRAAVPRSRLPVSALSDSWWMPFGGGRPIHEWRPRAHGLQGFDEGPSLWTVLDDGTINMTGFSPGPPHQNLQNAHFLGAFALHVAQILVMAERLRRQAGRPDTPIEIDIELRHEGSAKAAEGPGITRAFAGHINRRVEIGPLIFAARGNAERVFRELELQIWGGMGFRASMPAEVDFKEWLDEHQ